MKIFVWCISIAVLFLGIGNLFQSATINNLSVRTAILERKVNQLETDTVYLNMQIGTNRLLLMEMQRKFVPNHVALKERLAWQKKR